MNIGCLKENVTIGIHFYLCPNYRLTKISCVSARFVLINEIIGAFPFISTGCGSYIGFTSCSLRKSLRGFDVGMSRPYNHLTIGNLSTNYFSCTCSIVCSRMIKVFLQWLFSFETYFSYSINLRWPDSGDTRARTIHAPDSFIYVYLNIFPCLF